ncbi:MAG: deoxyhypusine synthase family protein [Nannocystaceae bacterium]
MTTAPDNALGAGPIGAFLRRHFRHFNAGTLVRAAEAYRAHVDGGGAMLVTLAGAMSTAELGISLAAMIRAGKVHAIACTGANLEEDLFNLVAHSSYVGVPDYRSLSPADERALLERRLNRVTDTCIPEEAAMRRIAAALLASWRRAEAAGERRFPHEFAYELIRSGALADAYEIDPADSWLVAAAERDLPIVVPGWEDSTLGNMYAAHLIRGDLREVHTVRGGVEYMVELARWYEATAATAPVGFFQIGGGIAGDFPICVVPMLRQDLGRDAPLWRYFCQISDSTTSYGSYSGATPGEKISWEKLDAHTPSFIIESDATIVAPLIFAAVLGW